MRKCPFCNEKTLTWNFGIRMWKCLNCGKEIKQLKVQIKEKGD